MWSDNEANMPSLAEILRHGLYFVSAMTIAVVFGAAGGYIAHVPSVAHQLDWGTVLAALLAAGGALLATKDYFNRQERDEISRRIVDDGFERFSRELADDMSRLEVAYKDADLLITMAELSKRDGCEMLIKRLTEARIPTIGHESIRVSAWLQDEEAIKTIATLYSDLTNAAHFCQGVVPLLALQALSSSADAGTKATTLQQARSQIAVQWERVGALRFAVQTGITSLSLAFQASRVTRFEQLADLRKLKPFGETLAKLVAESWRPKMKERDETSAKSTATDTGKMLEADPWRG